MPKEKEIDRPKAVKRAVDLLARAQKPGTKAEGDAASLALGKHLVKHPWLLEHEPQKIPTMASVGETVDKIRNVAADPNVKETVAAATHAASVGIDFLKAGADLLDRIKRR